MPTIQKAIDDHKAKMVMGDPQLNWCDKAVEVCIISLDFSV